MKFLTALFVLFTLSAFGANPSYKDFRGIGGITIVSNPPQGTIVIDGSSISAPTGGVSAATATNIAEYFSTNTTGRPAPPSSSVQFNSNWVVQGSADMVFTNGNLLLRDGVVTIGDGSSFGGSLVFSNEVGMYFTVSSTGPHYGPGLAGINYRSIINETISTGLLFRANAYIFENEGATWLMSLDASGLNVGSPAGAAPPNTLSKFEVAGNAAIGEAFARKEQAPANGMRVQGKVQIGTTNNQDFGQLTVSPSTSVDTYSTVTIGDTASPTNRAGLYIRSTLPGTAGISSAGTPIAFFQGGPGISETMRLVRDVGVGIFTANPSSTLDLTGRLAAASGILTNRLGIGIDPTVPLDVFKSDATMAKFVRDLATDVGVAVGADNSGVQLSTIGVHVLQFVVGAQPYTMTVTGFGIGTTTPTASLDATGQVRMASGIVSNMMTFWPPSPSTRMHLGMFDGSFVGGIPGLGTNFGFFSHESGRLSLFRSGLPAEENWVVAGGFTVSNSASLLTANGNAHIGGTLQVTNSIVAQGSIETFVNLTTPQVTLDSGAVRLDSQSSGVMTLYDTPATGFGYVGFGGNTAAFPAIGRTNGNLLVFGANGAFDDTSTNRLLVPGGMIVKSNYAAFGITTNNFALDTYYTNSAQRSWVSAVIGMTNVLATEKAHVAVYLDQDGDGTWERTGLNVRLQGVIALAGSEQLSAFIQPSGRFIFTNLGTAANASIEANSSQWVRQ